MQKTLEAAEGAVRTRATLDGAQSAEQEFTAALIEMMVASSLHQRHWPKPSVGVRLMLKRGRRAFNCGVWLGD